MPFYTAASQAEFLQQLRAALGQSLNADLVPQVSLFTEQFFSIVPLAELTQRRLTDLVGITLAAWRLLEQKDATGPALRVFNPDYEKHGWQSTHTAVLILQPDMPFLVDSVRMELSRRGLRIHNLQNSVLRVRRGDDGRLSELLPRDGDSAATVSESLIFLEVDRCANASELRALEQALLAVLGEVRLAVQDFGAMKAKALELSEGFAELHPQAQPEDLAEERDFFAWLRDEHFTFLGYEEFSLEETEQGGRLVYDQASLLGLSRELRTGLEAEGAQVDRSALAYLKAPLPLSFAKAARPSRIHRPAYPDFVSVRELDAQGVVVREYRFMGLFTAAVYTQSVQRIPFIRRKVQQIQQRARLEHSAHLAKELLRVLEVLPRDELFQSTLDNLCDTAIAIVQIQERDLLRLFLRTDPYGRFCYCLIYLPRDAYSTETRQKIQQVLMDRLNAKGSEFWTYFSESRLIRVQFILRLDPEHPPQIDLEKLEREVTLACRDWRDDYMALALDRLGESQGSMVLSDFPKGFPAGYRERFSPFSAVVDLQHLLDLGPQRPLVMSFYQPLAAGGNRLHCKIYHGELSLALSDVLPVLENLGLRVLGEVPYRLRHRDGREFWIHDFAFTYAEGLEIDLLEINEPLQDAFVHIIDGRAENDAFNRLVLTAGLSWREAALLRAYARYMKQIRLGFDLGYIANALVNHSAIARELVRLFKMRFYLARRLGEEDLQDKQERLEKAIIAALEDVAVLSEDRILRRYLDLIKATLRTNFYQPDAEGKPKDYFSFKFDPSVIPEMPRPVPRYEIFVYSPRVEGVHLRGGKVARGGLRWSDREEDYRTEVLGLVKAQQVKNAVIVPGGAKGGFVPRRLPTGSRDEVQAEAVACYRLFISGLLDITDNLQEGQVVPPAAVLRYDEDDPYLVVAADKGTASFSDIANEIAAAYGFWLGDAFASGGSAGYDHKKMGITAKGAWVSVQRHFRERGIDVQTDSIDVLGIGDMGGDVFGNGLLLSSSLRLVAAFNHQHIFLDPDPDPASSFAERLRLFQLPRSSWADYDAALISTGGGVYPRSAKSITLSAAVRERFAIQAERLTPTELIQALLKAPVDLLWNGGIGTYVKAEHETHIEVGDKANDALRVNGNELGARVVGEGGNLGMTQLGRVEYCLKGGACNTDFIDNSGGVDCSDHEVNIKILLNGLIAEGDLTLKQRNLLLAEMTDAVGELVLHNNYKQTQALSVAERRARERIGEYRRLIVGLESSGRLDRTLEFLPSDEALAERIAHGHGLTRAELAVLVSYSKIDFKEALLDSSLPDLPYLTRDMQRAFPQLLAERYGEAMQQHRLKREITATQVANDIVDHMGITFVQRLRESSGMSAASVASAYVMVRDIFHLPHWFRQIEALDHRVSADLQLALMDELTRMGRRATRWFLRNRRYDLNPAREVAHFGPRVAALGLKLDELLEGVTRQHWQERYLRYAEAGVPELLARMVAGTAHLYTLLPIVEAADQTGQAEERVAAGYFAVGGALDLNWYLQQITNLSVENNWQALAREGFRDDLDANQRAITVSVLNMGSGPMEQHLAQWIVQRPGLTERWRYLLSCLAAAPAGDYALHSVASRELQDLALSEPE
ncbi:NAD-glutamate dehydrogenase [Stutzerimonas tarimensis]|uniref:NAD-glutamate dehydrogenase n=1 Tax=Stutzerimonas tarimensis TaxID=1507735 RepID=A0ABV7T3M2_9GAMM